MAHPHPRPYPPPCYGGEALAVVAEALALERETITETARLAAFFDDALGRCEPATAEARLREAAERLAELSWAIQDPALDSPYAPLGADVFDLARKALDLIRSFRPAEPLQPAAPPHADPEA